MQIGEEIPSDITLLADFSTSQIPLGLASSVPDCLPVLSRRYSQLPAGPMDLAMPALTAESEMALWAAPLGQSNAEPKMVGALVLDHPAGRMLLAEFEESMGSEVELVTVFHGIYRPEVASEIAELLAVEPDVLLLMTYGESCRQAVLAVAESPEPTPSLRLTPAPCTFAEPSEQAWDGWLAFQQPAIVKERIEPTPRQALEDEHWSNFPNETSSVLAAWWIVDAIERGAVDRQTLLDLLLTTSTGPDWFPETTKFATQGTRYPLAVEGAPLLEQREGTWGQVDFIEVDPS